MGKPTSTRFADAPRVTDGGWPGRIQREELAGSKTGRAQQPTSTSTERHHPAIERSARTTIESEKVLRNNQELPWFEGVNSTWVGKRRLRGRLRTTQTRQLQLHHNHIDQF